MNARNVAVNLAGRPLRNRRFFAALLAAAAAAFVLIALVSGLTILGSRRRESAARDGLDRVRQATASVRKERDALAADTAELSRALKPTVDAVNGVILNKSFSLVDVFNRLEDALPAGTYIAGMSPLAPADGRLDLRFRLVSPGLADLLALVQKLGGLGFKNISVKNEATVDGRLVSEITFSHERPL
jgi:hypothetical protein